MKKILMLSFLISMGVHQKASSSDLGMFAGILAAFAGVFCVAAALENNNYCRYQPLRTYYPYPYPYPYGPPTRIVVTSY